MRNASAHAHRKEEARIAIARCRPSATSTAHPSSPEYSPKDPLADDAEATHVGNDEDDDDVYI